MSREKHQIVAVNRANFESAALVAANHSWLTFFSEEQLDEVVSVFGLDADLVRRQRDRLPNGNVLVIARGLMRGVYTYAKERTEPVYLHVASDVEIEPLRTYFPGEVFDIALSYGYSRPGHAFTIDLDGLVAALEARRVRVFRIAHGNRPDDPIWAVRYREAVFHSRYFVPILEADFNEHAGALAEIIEIAGLERESGSNCFLHPIVPIRAGASAAALASFRAEAIEIQTFKSPALRRLVESTVWIDIEVSPALEEFLALLIAQDPSLILAHRDQVLGVERTRLDGRPAARVYVDDGMSELPAELLLTPNTIRMNGRHAPEPEVEMEDLTGLLKWLQCGEPPTFAIPTRSLLDQNGLGPADDAMWHHTVARQLAASGHQSAAARHNESAVQRWAENPSMVAAARSMAPPGPARLDGPFDTDTCRFAYLWPGAAEILLPFTGIGRPTPPGGIDQMMQRISRASDLEDELNAVAAAVNFSVALSTRADLLRHGAEILRSAGQTERAAQWARWAACVPAASRKKLA